MLHAHHGHMLLYSDLLASGQAEISSASPPHLLWRLRMGRASNGATLPQCCQEVEEKKGLTGLPAPGC